MPTIRRMHVKRYMLISIGIILVLLVGGFIYGVMSLKDPHIKEAPKISFKLDKDGSEKGYIVYNVTDASGQCPMSYTILKIQAVEGGSFDFHYIKPSDTGSVVYYTYYKGSGGFYVQLVDNDRNGRWSQGDILMIDADLLTTGDHIQLFINNDMAWSTTY